MLRMNWIKSISSSLFGGGEETKSDLMSLDGTLYLIRRDGVRGGHECIFPDACAILRRTDDPFVFHLVITRMMDEDDVVEDSDPEDDEKIFVIHQTMRFHCGRFMDGGDSIPTFLWIDTRGNPQDIYEFAVPSVEEFSPMMSAFRQLWLECLYQATFLRSHENATQNELEALLWDPSATTKAMLAKGASAAPKNRPTSAKSEVKTPKSPPARGVASPKPAASAKNTKPALVHDEQDNPRISLVHLLPPAAPLPERLDMKLELDAEVYIFNAASREFTLVDAGVTVQIWQALKAVDESYLAIEGATGLLLTQPLDTAMNHVFYDGEWAFIWNLFMTDGGKSRGYSLSLKFETQAEFMQFKRTFSTAHIQATLHESLSTMKLSNDDMDYIMDQATEKEEKLFESNLSDDETASEPESEEDDVDVAQGDSEEDDVVAAEDNPHDKNSLLTTTRDRAFVVRGGKIGVFGYTPRGYVKFETMISSLKFNRQGLKPDKIMMYSGDRKMLLRDPKEKSKVYELDLGSEKIVNEWQFDDGTRTVEVKDMAPVRKSLDRRAPEAGEFTGITDRSVFRVDPRQSSTFALPDMEQDAYIYSKKMDFKSIVTTTDERTAVASGRGELRLYNKLGNRATTTLQGTGEPIKHLDVSANGRYVLATCQSYLLLFDVKVGETGNAFTKRMPAQARPDAMRLQLKPTHVAQMDGKRVCFTSAYFNVSPDGETTIVTSTGPYVVSWTLSDILEKKRLHQYTIKRYGEDVVADQFRVGDDKKIVLALPHDVQSISRSSLRKPDGHL